MLAARHGHVEIVQTLLNETNNFDQVDYHGNALLHHAVLNDRSDIVGMVLSIVSDATKPNKKGCTPFMHAIKNRHVAIVMTRLEQVRNIYVDRCDK